jgi:sugar transferase (PEP-CTERM/EpsH1 system associated)
MNVVFVSEMFPYPLDTGGNVRTFNLLKGLAAQHRVTLVSTTRGEVTPEHVQHVREYCDEIRLVPVKPSNLLRDVRLLASGLVSGEPFVLSRHRFKAVSAELRSLFARRDRKFDVVHFNHLDSAMYAGDVPANIHRVLDQHNVVLNQVKTTLANETHPLRKVVLRRELHNLRSYEAALCNRMQRCLACSQADVEALRAMGVVAPTVVIANGVDLEYFRPVPIESTDARRVVFLGTLDYDPCERAVWYFCTEILPLVRRTIPELQFVAVGRNPSVRLKEIANADRNVILTGRVEDVRTHVQQARGFAVPLLSGSGTRLKILEAMAMGIPVVSTTIGAEGLDIVHGEHAWIADTPTDFAAALVRVLTDLPHAREMSRKARVLVEDLYGWPAISAKLLAEYQSLAA